MPAFGGCVPALDGEGRQTLTYRRAAEVTTKRPIHERLENPTRISRVRTGEPHPELQRLKEQARWHEKKAQR